MNLMVQTALRQKQVHEKMKLQQEQVPEDDEVVMTGIQNIYQSGQKVNPVPYKEKESVEK